MHASYLFQQDKHYDLSYDTGDKALQCGRHVDVFKLWLMWRAKVSTGQLSDDHGKGSLDDRGCEVIARWKITWGVLFDPISAYPHSPWTGAQLFPSFVPSPVQWFLQLSTQNTI